MSNINTATRRRQWMIAGVAGGVMLALGGGIWAYSQHLAALKNPPPAKPADLTGTGLVNSRFTGAVSESVLAQQQNKTATLEKDLSTLSATVSAQNDALSRKLEQIGTALDKLQSQAEKPPAQTPSSGQGTPPASGPVSGGPSGPAQWSISNPGGGPAAGQGAQFYPAQGQGFYPGAGTVRPGGLSRDTFTYASLTDKKTKLPW
ncbi:conjugal transfer protein TraB, partial [Pantoea dispersa]|nr:conjugal transfer protein TraB [Pantoea dispersa]